MRLTFGEGFTVMCMFLCWFAGRCCATLPRRAGEVPDSRRVSETAARLSPNHWQDLGNSCHQLQSIVGSGSTDEFLTPLS